MLPAVDLKTPFMKELIHLNTNDKLLGNVFSRLFNRLIYGQQVLLNLIKINSD